MRRKSLGDYEVGKGRPPRHSQFKPGQSGNPNGRPRGSKNPNTILHEFLNRRVKIRESGKIRSVRALEAMLMKLIENGMKGDPKVVGFILEKCSAVEANLRQQLPPGITLQQAVALYDENLKKFPWPQ